MTAMTQTVNALKEKDLRPKATTPPPTQGETPSPTPNQGETCLPDKPAAKTTLAEPAPKPQRVRKPRPPKKKAKVTRNTPPPRRPSPSNSTCPDDSDESSEEITLSVELTKELSDSEMSDVTHTGASDTETEYLDVSDLVNADKHYGH
ncbi:proteoglycan 4-like [Penaeus japonicus]|uniref:proteoglycan 4-like n=1 Tax=Penaeus japonicus TaxID=27405 RepID=UPI001C70EF44|nr:proteoglycan 4-like [Penaeus japonicus]